MKGVTSKQTKQYMTIVWGFIFYKVHSCWGSILLKKFKWPITLLKLLGMNRAAMLESERPREEDNNLAFSFFLQAQINIFPNWD